MIEDKIFEVEDADESSGFLLWQVTSVWQREIRKALVPLDLTHSQFVLLASILWLSKSNESITQVVLSNHTKIDPMTTSTVLRTLQTRGLIKRQEHLTDTRAKTILLTDVGAALAKKAVKAVEQFDKLFFTSLGESKPNFNKYLIKLLLNFKDG